MQYKITHCRNTDAAGGNVTSDVLTQMSPIEWMTKSRKHWNILTYKIIHLNYIENTV
jgi:hypothetical protein